MERDVEQCDIETVNYPELIFCVVSERDQVPVCLPPRSVVPEELRAQFGNDGLKE